MQVKTKLAVFHKIATVRSTGPLDLAPILRNEHTGISVFNARPLLNNVSVFNVKHLTSLAWTIQRCFGVLKASVVQLTMI